MKSHANVVIIGGGIVGCSTAYHLAKMGCKDVVVVEKAELTHGSTWHAAGLVGQLRSSRSITQMLKYSVELYDKLEAETGQPTGWKAVGGIKIASSEDRMKELLRGATMAKSFGLEMHVLTPKETQDRFPFISLDGVVGSIMLPTDGQADPSMLTQAMAKGARDGGVTFERGTRVLSIEVQDGEAKRVVTDKGDITADVVVNCAGMWARELGQMVGVNVPLIPVQHQYLVTEAIDGMPDDLPTMRDPDNLVYYKQEIDGLVMGGYEQGPIPWATRGIPKDFGQQLFAEDYDQFETLMEGALLRTPVIGSVGVRRMINGPESFTTDGNFIMGRAPELKNFFVAAGFNAHGIAAGGGAGKMMAEWILNGEPSLNLWVVDIRRFGGYHKGVKYVTERTSELYGKHYTMGWPHEEHDSARGIRRSPLYDTLKTHGASYGSKFGWERANWFAPDGVEPVDEHTFGKPNWHGHVGNEHKAIRERVALIDQTPFSKIEVSGSGAFEYLQFLAANNIDKPVGGLTYTQLCNDKGGIESDLTIGRIGDDRFYIITGTAFGVHDMDWINRHKPAGNSVHVRDVTSSRGVINVCGPDSRRLLEKISDADLSSESFPFGTCREIVVDYAPVLALRITYVGELGWELHIPTEYVAGVYDALWEAGQELGITNAGYRAIESCRLEKGYRYWSTDLTPDVTPYEAGLGFCVDLDCGDFKGRDALTKVKAEGPTQRLVCFTIDEYVPMLGGETILRDGQPLGVVTSAGFGHTVEKTLAYGYVPTDQSRHDDYTIEVMGKPHAATRQAGALYDKKRERILA